MAHDAFKLNPPSPPMTPTQAIANSKVDSLQLEIINLTKRVERAESAIDVLETEVTHLKEVINGLSRVEE